MFLFTIGLIVRKGKGFFYLLIIVGVIYHNILILHTIIA